ncbi:hypothetical protein [Nonomuraea sp. NPDC049709]|uniref:hypothetical protein n=1 Tax=Nonomuraea sp. NPDC049709 TaxID=3154736 RepID=UPI00342DED04
MVELPTLRVSLTREGDVSLELVGTEQRETISAVAMGLPVRVGSAADLNAASFHRLPLHGAGGHAILDGVGDAQALLLQFGSPRGYLHLYPWEYKLADWLRVPVLRAPYLDLRPHTPGTHLRVVLCMSRSSPHAAIDPDLLEALVVAYSAILRRFPEIHVFADRRLPDLGPSTIVHDPLRPLSRRKEIDERLTSPWLRWIAQALDGSPIDVFHVLGEGWLSGGCGTLALASDPGTGVHPQVPRFVGVSELVDFLAMTGAWFFAVSTPPSAHSLSGLLELCDSLAQTRPGPVLLHDMKHDDDARELSKALSMHMSEELQPGGLASVSWWGSPFSRPRSVLESATPLLTENGESELLSAAARAALGHETTPTWIAAGARMLETIQAEWQAAGRLDADATRALRAVSALFDQHVRRHGPGGVR